jgi:hypothetical protein
VGVRTFEGREEPPARRRAPGAAAAALVVAVVLIAFLANGRPIGAGAPGPWAAAAATAPILAATRLAFAADATGLALGGKIAASLYCAVAAGLLFLAVGRRRPANDAWTAALLFAFGTTAWGASQWLSATPVSTALVAAAVLLLVLGEDDPDWAPRAGLPLGLAFAVNPSNVALVATLALSAAVRRPRQTLLWALWTAPGVLLGLGAAGGEGGLSATGFGADFGPRLLALFVGPADGLLVFAPVVVVALAGLGRALGRDDASLATGCAAAFLVHGVFVAGGPWTGGTWGPREWTDAMPLLLLFLPEGLDLLKGLGAALAALAVAVQALGAFSYDLRWDRLFAPSPERRAAAAWDVASSPIPFEVRERVVILALPRIHEGKVRIHEHRVVVLGPRGSRLSADASRLVMEGSDPTLGHAHLLGAARIEERRIRLGAPGDALFVRVLPESRTRRLEWRIVGRGRGTLVVTESTFWSPEPRLREQSVAGDFRVKLPYHYPESGGGDVTLALRAGAVEISALALVPPTEPENVIRLGP